MFNDVKVYGHRALPWCLATALVGSVHGVHAQDTAAALSLQAVVAQVRELNKDILIKRAEKGIAATGLDRAAAAFQPIASVSVTDGRNRIPSTYEERLSRGTAGLRDPFYLRDGQDYTAGVSQLLPSGAKLEAKSTLSRFITNINQAQPDRPLGAKDNRSFWGLTLTQPLAKDGGVAVTQARGLVAKLDLAVAEHTQSDTESSVVADATMAYYELVLAQQRVGAAHEKIRTGQGLLNQARELARQGRLPETEVWEVENALYRYQAGLSESVHAERERLNRLNTLLMRTADAGAPNWRASDALPAVSPLDAVASDALRRAMENRPDFLMRKKLLEREGVQLVYAQNQALPRIDLVATYGQNGLAYALRTALSPNVLNDNPTWTLGLQMQMPLGENRQGRADVMAAQLRRENALLALKAMEVQIANDIDTSLSMRASALERWTHWQSVAQREQQQLELERSRFAAGRSGMREILMREERAVNARLMQQEQQLAFAKAQVILESTQGTLLQRWPS
jgi:outer membrane protein TolC